MEKGSEKEKCVLCNKNTAYTRDTPIEMRYGYIEGSGQLCSGCYSENNDKFIIVEKKIIKETPNDMELGKKIRRFFASFL